jgi:CubicO group peptidase (beta-lactamase class C family)
MKKFLRNTLIVLALLAAGAAIYYGPSAVRVYRMIHLYDEDQIAHNFLNMRTVFPVSTTAAPSHTFAFKHTPRALPETFEFDGVTRSTAEYLDYSRTTGILVLKNDAIIHEEYRLGHHEDGHHISWSVAKSFVSAMVGIALEEELFASIEDPITDYLPEFTGTGYDGVRIKDILEMSSGVGFNEDYGDFYSDINRFSRIIATGGSMAEFAKTLERARPPGTYHHYVSIDTQVLGMLLRKVTGVPIAEYLQKKIWQPLGMEHDAHWLLDSTGMEVALGGLNASMRDYARFGLLYLNEGRWDDTQVVPRDWVHDSTTPDGAHLETGKDNPASSLSWGYGYQWWIPDPDLGDYTAAGIYNQYIYVNPAARVVIVKTSANHRYTAERRESKDLHIAMFRAIAQEFIDPLPPVE